MVENTSILRASANVCLEPMNKQQFFQKYFKKAASEEAEKMLAVLWVIGATDKLTQLGLIGSPGLRTLDMGGNGLEAWQTIHDNRKEWINSKMAANAITSLVTSDILGSQESGPTEEQLKNCVGITQLLFFYFDEPEEVVRSALIATSKKR